MPLFTKKAKKIVSVASGFGIDQVDAGLDIQTAYGLSSHWGVMGNYYQASGSSNGKIKEGGHGHLIELCLGYYTRLYKKALTFEVYGGSGGGKVFNFYDEDKDYTSTLKYHRKFVQTAWGWQNDYCKIAIFNRFGLLNYYKLQLNNANIITHPDFFHGVTRNKKYILIEPAFTTQVGYRAIKFKIQVVYSAVPTKDPMKQENFNINLGLNFDLPPLQKKSDK